MRKLVVLRNQYNCDPFFSSRDWLTLRYLILKEQGRRCNACGATGLEHRYHVDHILPRSKHPELALDKTNLQVLCEPCNIGKGSWDTTDWRNGSRMGFTMAPRDPKVII